MRAPPLLLLAGLLCLFAITAPSQEKETKEYLGELSLVRYDMPRGLSDGYAPTRQLAVRKVDAPEAVDWVDFSLNGKPLFHKGAFEKVPLPLQAGAKAASYFRSADDLVIEPGNHWLRAIEWRGGRRHIYTADGTARSGNTSAASSGRYELWTFPLQIRSEGAPAVKNVSVKYGGRVIYNKLGPWRSLTLLLPANEPGRQYELSVDGRATVRFDIGLMPVKLGAPREQLYRVDVKLPGKPVISVRTLTQPQRFPNRKEWNAAVASLGKPLPAVVEPLEVEGPGRWLGSKVPRSPVTTYAMALPHGRSGGFYGSGSRAYRGAPDEYAAHVAKLGFDLVFDSASSLPESTDRNSLEMRANSLREQGIQLGLQYDDTRTRPSLQNPNLPLLAHALPDWHAPLYRSLSLTAQRFARFPNFAGIAIGSDSGGYGPYPDSAPPAPGHPWGEALEAFMSGQGPQIPRAPSLGPREFAFERDAKATDEFIRYVSRYETTFRQYGYFAEAVREVSPNLVFTTGSFGSAPGAEARGGWPTASLPGRVMFEGVPVQQAYDWNDSRSAKPLHLVGLIDRLRSYSPRKKTWALLDNSHYLYGREAYQRAVAMLLTRGVQGVGTNFLPGPGRNGPEGQAAEYVHEMNEWIRRYGGVFARTEPRPIIGIFYGHHQAVLRPVVAGENPEPARLLEGSHEGKVAEALFLCHAAGWPARVITYQEMMREPLPASMKAIMLVGLEKFDESWHWAPGLEKPLRAFQTRGGKLLADDTSFSPVECERPGLKVASYVAQKHVDATPELLARNAANIRNLQAAMADVEHPIATVADPSAWVIPSQCGDVQYVTVVNQALAKDESAGEMIRAPDPRATKPEKWKTKANASIWVEPQVATLEWRTNRPIYDVALGRQVSPQEAISADLTKDAFRWYALPPAAITRIELVVQAETRGGNNPFYEALAKTIEPSAIRGVPVKITISRNAESVELFGATGWPVRLPIKGDDEGPWKVTATELLSGISASIDLKSAGKVQVRSGENIVQVIEPTAVDRFASRKHVALTIALTPDQAKRPEFQQRAKTLEAYYRDCGRIVSRRLVAPGDVVESLQPVRSPHRYPEWKTIPSDLVLLGSVGTNVLLQDQARGRLLSPAAIAPQNGKAVIAYTRSGFVGEYDVLNIIGSDEIGLAAGVKAIVSGADRD